MLAPNAFRPLLSVCVPTCDRAHLLPRAVKSVLAQEASPALPDPARDIEIVICDDASTDGTPDIARALAEKHGNVRYERAEPRLGIYANYTRAVELARGEFVAFVSDDDALTPRSCASRLEALAASPDAILCYGAHRDCRADGSERDKLPARKIHEESCADFVVRASVRGFEHTWNAVMLRRENALAALPFDEGIFPESDHDLQLRMAALFPDKRALYAPEVAVLRNHHAGNTYARHQAKAGGASEELWLRRQTRVKILGEYFLMRRRALELLAENAPGWKGDADALLRRAGTRLGWSRLRVGLAQIKNREFADARETLREAPLVSETSAAWLGAALLGTIAGYGLRFSREPGGEK